MVDIHSHILYGVDDGAKNEDESYKMLLAAKDIGIKKIIATPHILSSKNDLMSIKNVFIKVSDMAKQIGITLILGYEVHSNVIAEKGIRGIKDYRIQNTNTVLLELNSHVCPYNLEKIIYELQREELTIVIAHPERYIYIQKNNDIARRLFDLGCVLQVDAASLAKPRFDRQYKCAEKIISERLVSWIASDAHNVNDYKILEKVIVKMNYNMHC